MRRCSISKYIDESLPHGQVIHLGHRREELPEESHLQRRIFRLTKPAATAMQELTIQSSGAWLNSQSIWLRECSRGPGAASRTTSGALIGIVKDLQWKNLISFTLFTLTSMLQSSEEEKHTMVLLTGCELIFQRVGLLFPFLPFFHLHATRCD